MGELDLGEVPRQWDVIFRLADEVDQCEQSVDQGLTARKFDQSHNGGHRGYILASGHIQSGLEHIEAMRSLLEHHGATPRAPWTLLRAVFESGFWATWLMEPTDGLVRRRRGLQLEVRGMVERTNFYDDFLRADPTERARVAAGHANHEKTYRAEATALGLEWGQAKNRIVLLDELKKLWLVRNLETELQGPTLAIWRSLSGMQHGYTYALLLHSDTDSEQPILGGQLARLTIKDSAFQALASSANLMLIEGMNLYLRRSRRP
jgi:hypothetical protein